MRDLSGEIFKAVIPARGLGTRMRRADVNAPLDAMQSAAADAGVKAMISFGRPFLDYVLSAVADAGYREVCLIIGPEHGAIRNYYEKEAPPRRLRVNFAVQEEAKGSADAILSAATFAGDDEFLVINSDNYYSSAVMRSLRTLGEPGTALYTRAGLLRDGSISAERIKGYSNCEVGADGYLVRIVEKPEHPSEEPDALISMTCWRFGAQVFEACRRAPISPRGEYELPLAVQWGIDNLGIRLRVIRRDEGVLDLSSRGDVAKVAEKLRGVKAAP